MHSDDDSKTTLSKWPFILGDVLLVGIALAIAVLGDWQLSNWQVASCVMAVALGAGLYVLPFIVEFRVRVAEEVQDRNAELRILERHVQNTVLETERLDAGLRELKTGSEKATGVDAQLVEMVDGKIELLSQRLDVFSASIEGLKSRCADLEAQAIEKPESIDPEQIAELEKKIAGIAAERSDAEDLEALRSRIAALEARALEAPKPLELPAEVEAETSEADFQPVSKVPPKKPERDSQPTIERPKREPRVRHRPDEPRLLERAISEEQKSSSSAVTRIIGTKEKQQDSPAEENPAPEVAVDDVPLSALEQASDQLPEPEIEEDTVLEEDKQVEEPTDVKEEKEVEGKLAEAEEAPATVESTPAAKVSDDEPTKVSEKSESEMLFAEDPAPVPEKKKRVKKDDAVLTASVFIGIGNKPFLRGSGAGLSWEKGQAMEFQEIGKWRWVAPVDMEAPIEVQVFRNDEDGDQSGKYKLEPGQKLEVSPVF